MGESRKAVCFPSQTPYNFWKLLFKKKEKERKKKKEMVKNILVLRLCFLSISKIGNAVIKRVLEEETDERPRIRRDGRLLFFIPKKKLMETFHTAGRREMNLEEAETIIRGKKRQ